MTICSKCGIQLRDEDKFCYKCGEKVTERQGKNISKVNSCLNEIEVVKQVPVAYFNEKITQFLHLKGNTLIVSSDKYAFNFYRKEFRRVAKEQVSALKNEYFCKIQDLDSFLNNFFPLYLKYRERLIDNAMDIIFQAGIYDVSKQMFSEQHTKDFCLCAEDVNTMVESFNLTIKANQERKIRNYNMLPGIVFRGSLGGLLASTVTNAVINSIAESDIKNANVTTAQRQELFARINVHVLFERAFIDYWRVFLSLTWWLHDRGAEVWYPNQELNQRANGMFQNLCVGRVPKEKEDECVISIFQMNPYVDEYYKYIIRKYGKTVEIIRICEFFGYDIDSFVE